MNQTTAMQAIGNRWPLLLIFMIPGTAMVLAWVMYFTGVALPEGRTNKGILITPAVQLSQLQLREGDNLFRLEQLEGNWGVIVFGSSSCSSAACRESLYKTRQVHVALGKEADRMVRIYVASESPEVSEQLLQQHPNIFWLNGNESSVLTPLGLDSWPDNRFFIVDPLGNIMMGYQADQEGGDLLKDLKKLLKASSIG